MTISISHSVRQQTNETLSKKGKRDVRQEQHLYVSGASKQKQEWSPRAISIVAYCCSVKLYTLAAWVHLSQQYQPNNLYLRFLLKLAKRHSDFQIHHSTRRMSVTLRSFHLIAFAEDCSCVPSVFLRDFHTRKLQRILAFFISFLTKQPRNWVRNSKTGAHTISEKTDVPGDPLIRLP